MRRVVNWTSVDGQALHLGPAAPRLPDRRPKGYHLGYQDIGATRGVVVIPAGERFPLAPDIEAVPLRAWIAELSELFA